MLRHKIKRILIQLGLRVILDLCQGLSSITLGFGKAEPRKYVPVPIIPRGFRKYFAFHILGESELGSTIMTAQFSDTSFQSVPDISQYLIAPTG